MHYPPYASSIHIELYKSYQNAHYVQIFYRKAQEEHPTPMNIPDCGIRCPLDTFYDLYKAIMPENDFDTECKLNEWCNKRVWSILNSYILHYVCISTSTAGNRRYEQWQQLFAYHNKCILSSCNIVSFSDCLLNNSIKIVIFSLLTNIGME